MDKKCRNIWIGWAYFAAHGLHENSERFAPFCKDNYSSLQVKTTQTPWQINGQHFSVCHANLETLHWNMFQTIDSVSGSCNAHLKHNSETKTVWKIWRPFPCLLYKIWRIKRNNCIWEKGQHSPLYANWNIYQKTIFDVHRWRFTFGLGDSDVLNPPLSMNHDSGHDADSKLAKPRLAESFGKFLWNQGGWSVK